MTIRDSVGRGGTNNRNDVEIVQKLLNRNQYRMKSAPCLLVNGDVNNETVRAIETFQREVLRFRHPDGRVDRNKKTIAALMQLPPKSGPIIGPAESVVMIETGIIHSNYRIKIGEVLKSQISSIPAIVLTVKNIDQLLKEFGYTGEFREVKRNGRQYIVFKGYAGMRSIFNAPRYLANNPKILEMGIGKIGAHANLVRGSYLSLFTYTFIEAPQILFEYEGRTLGELGVRFGSDGAKHALSALAGYAGWAALSGASTALIVPPVAAGLIIAITVGIGLDYLDRRLKLTKRLEKYVSQMMDKYERGWARRYRDFVRGFLQWICQHAACPPGGF